MARDDFYASLFGVVYSTYMERPRLSRAIAWIVWGGDVHAIYASRSAVAEVAEGGTIVDCPCGAGPALRELRPEAGVRYVAADLSPSMLRRAKKRAQARALGDVGTQKEVERWLSSAGFALTDTGRSGPMLRFDALKEPLEAEN